MSASWNERRLAKRAKPGDGRPLKPFRWWQMVRRSVLSITLPLIAATLGTFESPLRLPPWLNLTLGLGAAVGAVERAMRMRYHWLLDSGAGT
jgi:hypothetical protein